MPTFGRNLCLYLVAGLFWSAGLMTFFLTYNLYLLDLGFREAFIGQVMASMTLGSLIIALPSVAYIHRFGLRRAIQIACLATGFCLLFRSLVSDPTWLVVAAFSSGVSIGMWVVAAPPFLAENTSLSNRNRVFSLSYGGSVGMGALAGLLVGYMAQWTPSGWLKRSASPMRDHQVVLGWGILLVFLAFLILLAMRENRSGSSAQSPPAPFMERLAIRFPRFSMLALFRDQFLGKLVLVVVLWNLFTGSFAPFFNVFFSHRYQTSLSEIGMIFSLSQFFQMSAIFCMPFLVGHWGPVRALSSIQLAAALMLPLLAFANHPQVAACFYLLYISLQVMGEPAFETFIMNSVPENKRNETSAVRYTTHFCVQAFATGTMGRSLEHLGYSFPFFIVGAIGLLSACTFYVCFRNSPPQRSQTIA